MSEVAKLVETQTGIVEFSPFEAALAEFRMKYAAVVYDLRDPAQEKRARSDRYAIGKVISKLDAAHKELKAPLLEQVQLLDGERRRIKDELLVIQDQIKSQIVAHEQALRDEETVLLLRIADIRARMVFDSVPTLDVIASRIESVKAVAIDHTFEHLINQAGLAKLQTLETLERLHADTLVEEQAAAERARIAAEEAAKAQQEREERIAREAAERARIAAEEAAAKAKADAEAAIERERLAKEKAERDAADAAARAAREAERAAELAKRQEAEAVEAAVRAERERVEREQWQQEQERKEREAREADEAHRLAVFETATEAVAKHGEISRSAAAQIVLAISRYDIPYIQIHY